MEVAIGRATQDPKESTHIGNFCWRCREKTPLLGDGEQGNILVACNSGKIPKEEKNDPIGRRENRSGWLKGRACPRLWADWLNLLCSRWKIPEWICVAFRFRPANSCWTRCGRKNDVWKKSVLHLSLRPWGSLGYDHRPHGTHGAHGAWARWTISKQEEPAEPKRSPIPREKDGKSDSKRTGTVWPRNRLALEPCKQFGIVCFLAPLQVSPICTIYHLSQVVACFE